MYCHLAIFSRMVPLVEPMCILCLCSSPKSLSKVGNYHPLTQTMSFSQLTDDERMKMAIAASLRDTQRPTFDNRRAPTFADGGAFNLNVPTNNNVPNSALKYIAQQSPLPRGWAEGKTPQGRTFYINHADHTTTWTRPNPPAHAQVHARAQPPPPPPPAPAPYMTVDHGALARARSQAMADAKAQAERDKAAESARKAEEARARARTAALLAKLEKRKEEAARERKKAEVDQKLAVQKRKAAAKARADLAAKANAAATGQETGIGGVDDQANARQAQVLRAARKKENAAAKRSFKGIGRVSI